MNLHTPWRSTAAIGLFVAASAVWSATLPPNRPVVHPPIKAPVQGKVLGNGQLKSPASLTASRSIAQTSPVPGSRPRSTIEYLTAVDAARC